VVAAAEDEHELTGAVLGLGQFQFWQFSFEQVGVDECGLVTEVFSAPAEMLWEMFLRLAF
jgi:hypothetical protein